MSLYKNLQYPVKILVDAGAGKRNSGKISISAQNNFSFAEIRYACNDDFLIQLKDSSSGNYWFDDFVHCSVLGNGNWNDTTGKTGIILLPIEQQIQSNNDLIIEILNDSANALTFYMNLIGKKTS